jgi:CO/xanthine dehydrogenase Mo-binding subunit
VRRALLAKHPRTSRRSSSPAKEAGWVSAARAGKAGEKRGRGVAVHESFNTSSRRSSSDGEADNTFSVDRVVCAVDCGSRSIPTTCVAQMEGGIGFGLSAAHVRRASRSRTAWSSSRTSTTTRSCASTRCRQ